MATNQISILQYLSAVTYFDTNLTIPNKLLTHKETIYKTWTFLQILSNYLHTISKLLLTLTKV